MKERKNYFPQVNLKRYLNLHVSWKIDGKILNNSSPTYGHKIINGPLIKIKVLMKQVQVFKKM